ncbi:SIS domain-containing protein [bacterium]|nr:SIS domain-containing protein [bacterium]
MIDDIRDIVAKELDEHRAAVDRIEEAQVAGLSRLVETVVSAWSAGGRLLTCGNGGSAADAQHLAAELTGRYRRDRPGWPAVALTTDTSALTAIGNDLGFDQVFARQVQALGRPEDVLLVISTSGDSENCVTAVAAAREIGLVCHGLLGGDGGRLGGLLDNPIVVPARSTPRIQELHVLMIHCLCEALERRHEGDLT